MLTNEYKSWVSALKKRYRATQIKAAVAVNSAMLEFYWSLGADISRIYPGKKRNLNFFENLWPTFAMRIASMSFIVVFHKSQSMPIIFNEMLRITIQPVIFNELLKIRHRANMGLMPMTRLCQK